ncbi:hypothetical protein [Bradyrhizobium sp. 2TAF24]|uniref:hypothetical protein n=1 Tax=Bradyrhizobium sp. 2TAF24 TaxID=3233011 RepID=UPI003F912D59
MGARGDLEQRQQHDLRLQMALAAVLFVAGIALSGISLFHIASQGPHVAELAAPAGAALSAAPVPADRTTPSISVK